MKTLKYYYDKGKGDGARDIYDPPHGIVDELLTWGKAETNHNSEENIVYTKGYFYAKGVEHCKLNKYEPPEADDHKMAYDEGFYKKEKQKAA